MLRACLNTTCICLWINDFMCCIHVFLPLWSINAPDMPVDMYFNVWGRLCQQNIFKFIKQRNHLEILWYSCYNTLSHHSHCSMRGLKCCLINFPEKQKAGIRKVSQPSNCQQTPGGVGGLASPSTSDRKSATCAAIFALFRQEKLPYTNERPVERLVVRPVRECKASTKCLQHFVDTLKAGIRKVSQPSCIYRTRWFS